jgi:hypothetical protein
MWIVPHDERARRRVCVFESNQQACSHIHFCRQFCPLEIEKWLRYSSYVIMPCIATDESDKIHWPDCHFGRD